MREWVAKIVRMGALRHSEVAREFEISTDSVRRGLKQARLDTGQRKDGLGSQERKELAKLRRGLVRLRTEREILARPTATFERETGSRPLGLFKFVRAHQREYPIACMCQLLGVSTSCCQEWLGRHPRLPAGPRRASGERGNGFLTARGAADEGAGPKGCLTASAGLDNQCGALGTGAP